MTKRLKELREEFGRLSRSAQEHGYSQDLKRRLGALAKDIKQEEAAQRFVKNPMEGDNEKESNQSMV